MQKKQLSIIMLIIILGTFIGFVFRIIPMLWFWIIVIIVGIIAYKVIPKME